MKNCNNFWVHRRCQCTDNSQVDVGREDNERAAENIAPSHIIALRHKTGHLLLYIHSVRCLQVLSQVFDSLNCAVSVDVRTLGTP